MASGDTLSPVFGDRLHSFSKSRQLNRYIVYAYSFWKMGLFGWRPASPYLNHYEIPKNRFPFLSLLDKVKVELFS